MKAKTKPQNKRSKMSDKTNVSVGEITINGTVYVPKGTETKSSLANVDGLKVVIVRSTAAGVHYGYLVSRKGDEVVLANTRRIWSWKGANCLSDLAKFGVSYPDQCKFSVRCAENTIIGACEVIHVTEEARACIEGVKEWK
jgi:hypothetical protein